LISGYPVNSDLPRGQRNIVSSKRPYAFFSERELARSGQIENVATIFLTNRECPFHCVMCDLWKNTLTESVESGDIPLQIKYALNQLDPADSIKLYNSGNFFDPKAIPYSDHAAIAELVRSFSNVIVENHPKLCTELCSEFQRRIAPASFEIAIGLETCHEPSLKWLDKSFELKDFEVSVRFLRSCGIHVRVFLLLGLPGLSRAECISWTLKSISYAADLGIDCFSIIPTRSDGPAFQRAKEDGSFVDPTGEQIEETFERALQLKAGRVFMDLWDAKRFFSSSLSADSRINRLESMNLHQTVR
jgi:uncharacterized Fe-S cluster-containing MiaB family protein